MLEARAPYEALHDVLSSQKKTLCVFHISPNIGTLNQRIYGFLEPIIHSIMLAAHSETTLKLSMALYRIVLEEWYPSPSTETRGLHAPISPNAPQRSHNRPYACVINSLMCQSQRQILIKPYTKDQRLWTCESGSLYSRSVSIIFI